MDFRRMRKVLNKGKGLAIALALFMALVWLLSRLFQLGSTAEGLPAPPADQVAEAEELRDYALTGEPPAVVVEVDYAEQGAAFAGPMATPSPPTISSTGGTGKRIAGI